MRCMGKASMALQIKLDSLYKEHLVRQPPENEHWFSTSDPCLFTTFTSAGLCLWLLLGGGGGSPFLALISLFRSFRERDGTRCLATPISSQHSFFKGSAMKNTIYQEGFCFDCLEGLDIDMGIIKKSHHSEDAFWICRNSSDWAPPSRDNTQSLCRKNY